MKVAKKPYSLDNWCRLFFLRTRAFCGRLFTALRILLWNPIPALSNDQPLEWGMKHYQILSTVIILILYLGLMFFMIWTMFSSCTLFPSIYIPLRNFFSSSTSSAVDGQYSFAWMDVKERILMEKHMKSLSNRLRDQSDNSASSPGLRMLEYGAGSSTFYFSSLPFVSSYDSVEHSMEYCEQLTDRAEEDKKSMTVYKIGRKKRKSADSSTGKSLAWEKDSYDLILTSKAQIGGPSEHSAAHINLYCISQNLPRTEELSWWSSMMCCLSRCPSTYAQFRDYIDLTRFLPLATSNNPPGTPPAPSTAVDSAAASESSQVTKLVEKGEKHEEGRDVQANSSFDVAPPQRRLDDNMEQVRRRRLLNDNDDDEDDHDEHDEKRKNSKKTIENADTDNVGGEEVQHRKKSRRSNEFRRRFGNLPAGDSYNSIASGSFLFSSSSPPVYDVVFVDGRARPQVATSLLPQLHKESLVFLHDVNWRRPYQFVLQFFDIVDKQMESDQPGGGGLYVLRKKENPNPVDKANYPYWYFDDR